MARGQGQTAKGPSAKKGRADDEIAALERDAPFRFSLPVKVSIVISTIAGSSLYLRLVLLILEPLFNSIPLQAGTKWWFGPTVLLSIAMNMFDDPLGRHLGYATPLSAVVVADMAALGGRDLGSLAILRLGTGRGAAMIQAALLMTVLSPMTALAAYFLEGIFRDKRHTATIAGRLLIRTTACTLILSATYYAKGSWHSILGGGALLDVQSPEPPVLALATAGLLVTFYTFATSHTVEPGRRIRTFRLRKPLTIATLVIHLVIAYFVVSRYHNAPIPPYTALGGKLRILDSQRSITGQIVVAEDLERGFRFLRADASILGGKWFRDRATVAAKQKSPALGDSVFATFPLQEVGVLARSMQQEVIHDAWTQLRNITGVASVASAEVDDTYGERALIIGLGVGIAASAFAQRGIPVDIVEIDPLVYQAARDQLDLIEHPRGSVSIQDGMIYVRDRARQMRAQARKSAAQPAGEGDKWGLVVQDCFSGGMVPGELFTVEFWEDLKVGMKADAIVAVNFVGAQTSKPFRAVLRTLLSSFAQCRGFAEHINMVVLCTPAYSPLLTFRRPRGDYRKASGATKYKLGPNDDVYDTDDDYFGSPLRHHVYNTMYEHEIILEDLLGKEDYENGEMLLRRGKQRLGKWQVDIGVDTSQEIQKLLTPDMWLTY